MLYLLSKTGEPTITHQKIYENLTFMTKEGMKLRNEGEQRNYQYDKKEEEIIHIGRTNVYWYQAFYENSANNEKLREYPEEEFLIKYCVALEHVNKDINKDKYQKLMEKLIPKIMDFPASLSEYLRITENFPEGIKVWDDFINNGTPCPEIRPKMCLIIHSLGRQGFLKELEREFFELLQNEHLEYVEQMKKEFPPETATA